MSKRQKERLPAARGAAGSLSQFSSGPDYGLGLEVVVVVVVDSFFSVAGGFTTVVLCSTFFSGAGDEAGATTVSFCSQAPRSAALAKMQNSFFISFDWLTILDTP